MYIIQEYRQILKELCKALSNILYIFLCASKFFQTGSKFVLSFWDIIKPRLTFVQIKRSLESSEIYFYWWMLKILWIDHLSNKNVIRWISTTRKLMLTTKRDNCLFIKYEKMKNLRLTRHLKTKEALKNSLYSISRVGVNRCQNRDNKQEW